MILENERQQLWNGAYHKGGNILFYPHEEIIRFINKYVRKRVGADSFKNVLSLSEQEWKNFASLDLGCGIGRHVKFLDEFGLNPYGIDLSDAAIAMGKDWLSSIGKPELAAKMTVASVTELPYEDDYFQLCVSHSVLDCMSREIAVKGLQETYRVLKKNGLMYFDTYLDPAENDRDHVVDSGFGEDTIQSFFTVRTLKEFVGTDAEILEFKIITWSDDKGNETNRRAHIILRKK